MEFKLFGFTFGDKKRKNAAPKEEKRISFVPPQNDDDALTFELPSTYGLAYIHTLDIDGTTRSNNDLIYKYRQMSMHPEIEMAIEDIICEAIVTEENELPVKIVLDNTDLPSSVKKKITNEFKELLFLLQFQTKGYEMFRRWYVDSKLVYHIITAKDDPKKGILEIRYVDPMNIQKVRVIKKDNEKVDGFPLISKAEEYYVYTKNSHKNQPAMGHTGEAAQTSLKIEPDAIVHITSGMFDPNTKRTIGFLHKAIKPLNQLRMMEDAIVIYRVSRAPERRIFYVDTGDMPKHKAEAYVLDVMNRHKNKLTYDSTTGEMQDGRRHMSMLEDYWFPRMNGSRGTEITTLPGGQNLSELEDVKYFQKKLYKSLNVPISRMDSEQKSFSIGKSTEITRDEVKFSKFISRLRNKFSELFYQLLKTQLILKNIMTEEEWDKYKNLIFFDYNKDSYFAELKQNEIMNTRLETLTMMDPYIGRFFSDHYVMKYTLGFNDEEIEDLQSEIEEDKKKKEEEQAEKLAKQLETGVDEFGNPVQPPAPPMDGGFPPGKKPPFGKAGSPQPQAQQPPQDTGKGEVPPASSKGDSEVDPKAVKKDRRPKI